MVYSIEDASAAVVTDLIKSSFDRIFNGGVKLSKDIYQKIFEDFAPYMKDCHKRNRYVRILCNDDSDVDLNSVYVGSHFRCGHRTESDLELVARAGSGENFVVVGNGGAGKTFFMRRLWLDLFKEGPKTPIFIELRRLNGTSKTDLISFIKATISNGASISDNVFDSFCASGRFVFILDGFDELLEERHNELQDQINNLVTRYPECSVVVSSRPDSRFSGWQNFSILEALPFTITQTKELCGKIPFEVKSQNLFLRKITPDFFKENESFLSNPLLAIMMMMTFKVNMDIPKKIGIFYDQAFNTLFQWHDSTKSYERKKLLDIQQFRRSFGIFCLLSYFVEMFEFTKSEIIEKIVQSNNLNGFDFDPEQVFHDYEMKVNLIRQDGLRYVFIHRSFQEYFAAYALTEIVPQKFGEVAKTLLRRRSDSVIKMCYDLQRNLVIRDLVRPMLEDFRSKFNQMAAHQPEGRFRALSFDKTVLGISYQTEISAKRRPKSKSPLDRTITSMSYQSDDEIGNFVLLIDRLSGTNEQRPGRFFGGALAVSINSLREVIASKSLPSRGEVILTFEQDSIVLRADHVAVSDQLGQKDLGEYSVENTPEPINAIFEERNAERFEVMKRCIDWAEKEVLAESQRDKTLNELFGV